MSKYRFRCIALDETIIWASLPPECTLVYGVYVFIDGEATFCASTQPSSWCDFVCNYFVGLPLEHPFVEYSETLGEPQYMPFIDVVQRKNDISAVFVVDAHCREEAWELARTFFISSLPEIPVLRKH